MLRGTRIALLALLVFWACKPKNQPPVPGVVIGPGTCQIDSPCVFTTWPFDPDGDSVACEFDWGDSTRSGWSDFVGDSAPVTMSKTWSAKGSYAIRTRVRDARGALADWSASFPVIVTDTPLAPIDTSNKPPIPYIVAAPDFGIDHFIYQFSFCAVDPESADVDLYVDWGDGTGDELVTWWDPCRSGETVPAQHAYVSPGDYDMVLYAEDSRSGHEAQSEPREVHISAAPLTGWTRTYSSEGAFLDVHRMSDGGYTESGMAYSGTSWDSAILRRVDHLGNLRWTKSLFVGNTFPNRPFVQTRNTSDDGYISFGEVAPDTQHFSLVRCNSAGERVWQRSVPLLTCVDDLRVTPGGDYVLLGRIGHTVALMRTDSAGDTIWSRMYPGIAHGERLGLTADGGYVVAGYDSFVQIVRLDADGALVWNRELSEEVTSLAAVRQAPDGGYIVAGSACEDMGDPWAVVGKIDAAGTPTWHRSFFYGGMTEINGMEPTPDGGCIIAGVARAAGYGDEDIYVARLDRNGDFIWQRLIGGRQMDGGDAITTSADGGYVVAGYTMGDDCLIKIDRDGMAQPGGLAGKGPSSTRNRAIRLPGRPLGVSLRSGTRRWSPGSSRMGDGGQRLFSGN